MTAEAAAGFTVVMLACLLVCEAVHARAGVWIFKPLASLGFVVTGLVHRSDASLFGTLVVAALVLSAVGDVLLIPKSKKAFLGGLVSFLLGHVMYAAAFVCRGVALPAALAASLPMIAAAIVVGRWLIPKVEQKLKKPVLAYMIVISAMVALAVGTHAAGPIPLALGGAVAFYLSDLSVARDRFVRPGFVNRSWGLPLYYGAQLLFAWAI